MYPSFPFFLGGDIRNQGNPLRTATLSASTEATEGLYLTDIYSATYLKSRNSRKPGWKTTTYQCGYSGSTPLRLHFIL